MFEQCENGEHTIFVPSIVIAEALSIFDNKRVSFDFKKTLQYNIEESENFVMIPLDYPILLKMVDLKDIPELHDKIIVSTALYLDLPVITKDRTLIKLSPVNTIW